MNNMNNTNAEPSPAGRKRIEKPELMSNKTKNRRFAELDEKMADVGILPITIAICTDSIREHFSP